MNNRKTQLEQRLNYIKPKQRPPVEQNQLHVDKRNEQRFNQSQSDKQENNLYQDNQQIQSYNQEQAMNDYQQNNLYIDRPRQQRYQVIQPTTTNQYQQSDYTLHEAQRPIQARVQTNFTTNRLASIYQIKRSTTPLQASYTVPKQPIGSFANREPIKINRAELPIVTNRKEQVLDKLTTKTNREPLTIKQTDLTRIKKRYGNSRPHLHVAKDGTISKKVKSSNSALVDNKVATFRQGIVLDRLKNKIINDHIHDTDIGFQATHSANRKRKTAVRTTKSVKNFFQSKSKTKHLASGTGHSAKLQLQGVAVGALESANPVEDTGFTATSRTASNAKTVNETLKKGKSFLQGKKKIEATNAVRERNRIAQMKGITQNSAQALQKGVTSVIDAGKVFIAKIQESIGAKVALILAIFFGMILILGIAMGGSGTSLEMKEEEELSFSANGLGEDVLQWQDTVEQELEKYNLTEYTDLLLVIIHLESRGKLPDVMQSSESIGLPPNSIKDPEESIKVGVKHFKSIYDDMAVYGVDIQTLIQAYNFGNGFIPYVAKNGKEWKQQLSDDFADMHAKRLGWSSYGDSQYVSKAMQYLTVEDDEIKLNDTDFDLDGGKLVFPVPNHSAVSSSYGWRIHPISGKRKFHTGTDIPAPTGTPVVAAADGVVAETGWKGGYGNAVVIDHGSNVTTLYAHNSSLEVQAGQNVKAGQVVAKVGSTGNSTGPHSHFEVQKNGNYTDPLQWFD